MQFVVSTEHTLQHTAQDIREYFRTHQPALKRVFVDASATVGLLAVLNVTLFALQFNRLAPFTTIDGKNYGFTSLSDAQNRLIDEHANASIAATIDGKSINFTATEIGVNVAAEATVNQVSSRHGWNIIPMVYAFSNFSRSTQTQYRVDEQQIALSLESYITSEIVEPVEATLTVPQDMDAPIAITNDVAGRSLTAEIAAEEVASSVRTGDFALTIAPKRVDAKWSADDFKAIAGKVENARKASIELKSGEETLTIKGDDLNALVIVNTSGEELLISLDEAKLATYLRIHADGFAVAPTNTKVTLKDGVEVAREAGVDGKQADAEASAKVIRESFEKGIISTEPVYSAVAPGVVYIRTYSNTDDGLYKLLSDFDATHGGSYKIAAVELEGPGHRSAFYQADDPIVPASTYKLFIAYAILQRIEKNELAFESSTAGGTVGYCMRRMIVVSDNGCAAVFHDMLGWAELDAKLQVDGFTGTKLNNKGADYMYTTARDEMAMLTKLYFNELLTDEKSNYLLGLMREQIYRMGIPSASRGALVDDKVGMLYNWNHDIAIVYGKKTTYALVILTEGTGYGNIRALSTQVYDFYNQ